MNKDLFTCDNMKLFCFVNKVFTIKYLLFLFVLLSIQLVSKFTIGISFSLFRKEISKFFELASVEVFVNGSYTKLKETCKQK